MFLRFSSMIGVVTFVKGTGSDNSIKAAAVSIGLAATLFINAQKVLYDQRVLDLINMFKYYAQKYFIKCH